jgi:hypothetical protein
MISALLRIETRHSAALWLAPIMAGLAWWAVARAQLSQTGSSEPDARALAAPR